MGGVFTEVILVPGVSGQVPEEAGERAQLQVVVGALQEILQHRQHALLLQGHLAQHRRPLQGRARDGGFKKCALCVPEAQTTGRSGGSPSSLRP